jgi:hypothetical protein
MARVVATLQLKPRKEPAQLATITHESGLSLVAGKADMHTPKTAGAVGTVQGAVGLLRRDIQVSPG